jgi:putative copper resistance protein D
MRLVLLGATWIHLAASVLLTGAFSVLLLAGPSKRPTARRWERTVAAYANLILLVALGSGIAWLLARTAVFEGRPEAAFEPRAVWHALLDTRPGRIWLTRHCLLVVLGAFLLLPADLRETRNWIVARVEALVLGMLALALVSGSSHAAGVTPRTALAVTVDVAHLLGSGVWIGGLIPLVLLLRAATPEAGADSRPFAVLAARRFSGAALATMIVLMASGAMNALAQVESIPGLAGTAYGHLLLAKLSVLVPILALAAVNRARLLPALSGPSATVGCPAMRRLAAFIGLEAILALVLLALVAAMTLTTPARHEQPVWPLPFRLSLDTLRDGPAARWQALLGSQLVLLGAGVVVASRFVGRRRAAMLAGSLVLIAIGAGVGLAPIVVDAYPTTYRRPPVTYHAASIAPGMPVYREHCASCHGATGAGEGPSLQGRRPPIDLRSPPASLRHAGEIFWLITHGIPARGMPGFEDRLGDGERWAVINFIRALGAAGEAGRLGRAVEPERPWLVAPDFAVSVGPLAPGALRDYRGRRIVLLVFYTLPGSRPRMMQLARSYDLFWVMGVEVIAVPTDASPEAIRELGASPPVLFPVVTDGALDIVQTYRIFAPGPHAEFLIDRQGYIRAIWKSAAGEMPEATALLGQVEQLNEEKSVVPFPDDHIH